MHEPDHVLPPYARTDVMWALARNGGSLRIGPLLNLWIHSRRDLWAVIDELEWRRWLKIVWRPKPDVRQPKPFARIDRIVATPWGRSRMAPLPRRDGRQPAKRSRGVRRRFS